MTQSRSRQRVPPSFVVHSSIPVAWAYPNHPYYEQARLTLGMFLVSGATAIATGSLWQRTHEAVRRILRPTDLDIDQEAAERRVRRAMLALDELLELDIIRTYPQPAWNPAAATITGRYGVRSYDDAVDIDFAIATDLPLLLADDELRQQALPIA